MMTAMYDHRAADVVFSKTATKRKAQPLPVSQESHQDPKHFAMPAYWISEAELPEDLPPWLLAFSSITSPTNQRSLIAYAIPRTAVGNSLPIIFADKYRPSLLAILCSFVVDFALRQKIGGTNLNYFYLEQIPVLSPDCLSRPSDWAPEMSLDEWISLRVLELVYAAEDMVGIASELGYSGPPFAWDLQRRSLLKAELDAAIFHLYSFSRDNVEYVLESFTELKNGEISSFGSFRTAEAVLDAFDRLAAYSNQSGTT